MFGDLLIILREITVILILRILKVDYVSHKSVLKKKSKIIYENKIYWLALGLLIVLPCEFNLIYVFLESTLVTLGLEHGLGKRFTSFV